MVIMHKNNLFMYFFSVFPYTFCIFAIKNIRLCIFYASFIKVFKMKLLFTGCIICHDLSTSIQFVFVADQTFQSHRTSCRYAKQKYGEQEYKIEMEREDAKAKGYTPCLVCGGGKEGQ